MNVGDEKKLNKDARYKDTVWAKKGDKIKIISISGNAVICEKQNGSRFPANIKDLQ